MHGLTSVCLHRRSLIVRWTLAMEDQQAMLLPTISLTLLRCAILLCDIWLASSRLGHPDHATTSQSMDLQNTD